LIFVEDPIVFSELENVLSTEQCRYNISTKNRNLPTTIQQAVAMSNNDDMEINIDSFRGKRGTREKRVQQKARWNKSDHRGSEEKERDQLQREYILKLQQETDSNANYGEWTQVGDRGQGPREMKETNRTQKASGNKDGQNGSKESEREQQQHEQARKLQQAPNSNDKRERIGGHDNDGMSSYKVKTGVIEVRFMKSGDAGFNVARSLKEFIAAARESDKEFSILPLSKEGNNIFRAADVPNTKDGIGNYYRHVIKFNNINVSMRIRTSMDIGRLKQAGSAFRMYLQSKRVYINKAQLGIEAGVTLGWLHQAHPSFCYREDIKERLKELMGEEHKSVQYALFPKSIKYKRIADGVRLTTTGVMMQIAKSPNATAADFRATMAEKWQSINAKNGRTLYDKTFIPFVKEGDMGYAKMTNVIQQQNKFLAETKQRIVHNLNDVDEIIEIALGEDVDMDSA
jgi:hypothetical protein